MQEIRYIIGLVFNWNSLVLWNLFLVFFPFAISEFMYRKRKKWGGKNTTEKIRFIFLFIIWFFFFPNIPYLFSEIRHLFDLCIVQECQNISNCNMKTITFHTCMKFSGNMFAIFSYAVISFLPFIISLRNTSRTLGKTFKKYIGFFFPVFMIPFTSYGLILGLIGRFNSWDLMNTKGIKNILFLKFPENRDFLLSDFLVICISLFSIYYISIIFLDKFFLRDEKL